MALQFNGWFSQLKSQSLNSLHSFTLNDIEGNPVGLDRFKGKKLLIVNTASECGFTPQYKDLEELNRQYKDKGLVILGFPCNDFGIQEPGSHDEISTFCKQQYGVTFLLMEKVSVKGENIHPLYKWLTTRALNGKMNTSVKWNFQKYMVDERGQLVGKVAPWRRPGCRKIRRWLDLGSFLTT